MTMLNKATRLAWLLDYMLSRHKAISFMTFNVLDQDFVDSYVEATKAPSQFMLWGADRCPQLGKDLSYLHKQCVLMRVRTGIQGLAGQGFPKWVWSYRLTDSAEAYRLTQKAKEQ